ncbi:unnamed protein product [Moneuplotes crassus]|uniref:INO80 complex subunit B-like conserved region domain-containing protein n=1 Tax=Euplotes crassus TaxID=5936 RepID=A0AAD1XN68_EUPCR|nr:unnamed protein product [Moneuplotes crassus]
MRRIIDSESSSQETHPVLRRSCRARKEVKSYNEDQDYSGLEEIEETRRRSQWRMGSDTSDIELEICTSEDDQDQSETIRQDPEFDFDRMTKRQRQAFLVKNNMMKVSEKAVEAHGGQLGERDETVAINHSGGQCMYSLDTIPKNKSIREKVKSRKDKTLEEEIADKRKELTNMLKDLDQKTKIREKRHKENMIKKAIMKVKKEEIAQTECVKYISSIRRRDKKFIEAKILKVPPSAKMTYFQLSSTASLSNLSARSNQKCDNCGTNSKKYKCSKSAKFACSLPCYRQNLRHFNINPSI